MKSQLQTNLRKIKEINNVQNFHVERSIVLEADAQKLKEKIRWQESLIKQLEEQVISLFRAKQEGSILNRFQRKRSEFIKY